LTWRCFGGFFFVHKSPHLFPTTKSSADCFHDHHAAFLGFEQGAWLKQAVRDFFAYHAVPPALSWAGGGLYGIA